MTVSQLEIDKLKIIVYLMEQFIAMYDLSKDLDKYLDQHIKQMEKKFPYH